MEAKSMSNTYTALKKLDHSGGYCLSSRTFLFYLYAWFMLRHPTAPLYRTLVEDLIKVMA